MKKSKNATATLMSPGITLSATSADHLISFAMLEGSEVNKATPEAQVTASLPED